MSSFLELQALAAERSRIAEAKAAEERRRRQQEEKQKNAAAEANQRERAKRQREILIEREKKKKEDAEQKKKEEELKRQKREQKQQQMKIEATKPGNDMRKFVQASQKAIKRAGGSSNGDRKRQGIQEDEDGFLSSPNYASSSALTREEKRAKRQMAMLGLSSTNGSGKRSIKRKANKNIQSGDSLNLTALGTIKRDKRSIDEIECDLRKSKRPTINDVGKSKNPLGLSPADYLPGAPVRADLIANSQKKAKDKQIQQRKAVQEDPLPVKRRETARDRFLREEEERKKERSRLQGASQRYEEEGDEEEEEEDEEDEYESDGIDDDTEPADFRDQIWEMFGKKRSAYVNRKIDDSDDDMEADMESVAREEARSSRLARLEDEREERELRKKEQEKAAKKAGRRRDV